MKILMINKFYRPVGGPETVVFDTTRELVRLGHTVIPFAMSHPDNVETEYSRYFVPQLDYNSAGGKGPGRLFREAMDIVYSRESKRRIEQLISDTKPDIAHLHNIYHQLSPSILVALKRAGIPTVLTLHDGKLMCANMLFISHGEVCERCAGRWFHHAVLRRCVKDSYSASLVCCVEETLHRVMRIYEKNVDLFISPSQFLRDKLVECGRLPEDKVRVLYNYAHVGTTPPATSSGDYGLYLGRVETYKGVGTLLDACRRNPDIPVRIAGDGGYLRTAQDRCRDEGIHNVEFAGFVTGDVLSALVAGARFVLVPSQWYENCPMVVLEAFSAGKPVIASEFGGIPELVDHGTDGLLFKAGDTGELAQCMRALFDDPAKSSGMGARGYAKVAERFSLESYMGSLLEIYRGLVRS